MTKLKATTVQVIQVSDWDEFVSEVYGKIYSFQQQDDCKPRGTYPFSVPSQGVKWCAEQFDYENTEIPFEVNGEEMGVSFETWLNTKVEDTEKHFQSHPCGVVFAVELFWERNFYPRVETIIWDLYKRGLLDEGEYMINIDW
jgi:hypothetical protein